MSTSIQFDKMEFFLSVLFWLIERKTINPENETSKQTLDANGSVVNKIVLKLSTWKC